MEFVLNFTNFFILIFTIYLFVIEQYISLLLI